MAHHPHSAVSVPLLLLILAVGQQLCSRATPPPGCSVLSELQPLRPTQAPAMEAASNPTVPCYPVILAGTAPQGCC